MLYVLFLIILISPELTAQLTCFNEDLLNKTVVEVYLILSTVSEAVLQTQNR